MEEILAKFEPERKSTQVRALRTLETLCCSTIGKIANKENLALHRLPREVKLRLFDYIKSDSRNYLGVEVIEKLLDKSVTQVLFQNTIQFQAPQAKKLTEICPNLTHLSISGCHKLQDLTPLIDAYANTLVSFDCSRLFYSSWSGKLDDLTRLKKLERLSLTGNSISGEFVLRIAQSCPNIKSLHLPALKSETSLGNGNHLLKLHEYLPNLEELKLIDPIDFPLENYHNLRRLEIICVARLQTSLQTVLQRLANLEHLEYVKLDGELNGTLPLEFAANQRKLTVFSLKCRPSFEDEQSSAESASKFVDLLIQNNPNLEGLELVNLKLKDDAFQHVDNLRRLLMLTLTGLHLSINGTWLENCALHCPLIALQLHCSGGVHQALNNFLQKAHTTMQYIELHNCAMTNETLDLIGSRFNELKVFKVEALNINLTYPVELNAQTLFKFVAALRNLTMLKIRGANLEAATVAQMKELNPRLSIYTGLSADVIAPIPMDNN